MLSDEILYNAAQDGSHTAFRELYARYERPLFGFIMRRIGNRQDAEDVFHDVMLAVLKEPDCRFERGGFAAWIYKVALHRSLNKLRTHRRFDAAKNQLRVVEPHAESAEQPLEYQEQAHLLAKASEQLSLPLRQVYELRKNGKTYEETAQILGLPVGSVKSRINALVRQLRKEMTRWTAK